MKLFRGCVGTALADVKPLNSSIRFRIFYLYGSDVSGGRAFSQRAFEVLKLGGRPGCVRLDATVGEIPDPACELQLASHTQREVPVSDPLHSAAHQKPPRAPRHPIGDSTEIPEAVARFAPDRRSARTSSQDKNPFHR